MSNAASGSGEAAFDAALDSAAWIIQSWAVDEGLPESSATALVQTSDQYLWFGTFGGLVRFDGVTFTVFDPDNTPQLPSPAVVNLHADCRGRLWVSTAEGLVVRDGGRWLDFSQDPVLADELGYIRTFAERDDGALLLTTFNGKIVECQGETLLQLPEPPGEPGEGYWCSVDDDGRWWVVQHQFIGSWDGAQWVRRLPLDAHQKVDKENVACVTARDGGVWVLVNAELLKFSHGVEISRRQLSEAPVGVWSLFEDSQGTLWMPSYSMGLYQLPSDGRLQCRTQTGPITCKSYRFVFEDHERNLWVGTNANGLIRLTARRFRDLGTREAFSAPVASVAPAAGGGMWIGTYGDGLFKLDHDGLAAAPFSDQRGFGFSIGSVLTDRQGRTWVGLYYDLGLFVFDGQRGRFVQKGQLARSTVTALFEDSGGRIWISGGRTVAVVKGDVVRAYGPDEGLPPGKVVCFAEDHDGAIWLSNLAGVFRLADGRFVEVPDAAGGPIRNVACLKSENDGTMWMGSTKAGLLRWRAGALATIGPGSGLPTKQVLGILSDDAGYFWMSSNRGVLRVARRELQDVAEQRARALSCQVFDTTDGLPTMECSGPGQPVCVRDPQGRLWFATAKGVGVADPDRFAFQLVPPQIHLEQIVYRTRSAGADKSWRVDAPFAEFVHLPAGSHGVEFHYAAPCFAAPGRARFQIQLEPVDSTWQDVGNRRVAYYDHLPAGQYRFRVRAANGDGVWSAVDAGAQISVAPFFYETAWFRGSIAAVVAGAVLAHILRFRARLRRRRAAQAAFTRELIARQEAERSRIASELHDGLGHRLLLIKNRLGRIAAGGDAAAEVTEQLGELSGSAMAAITEVRSISRALRPSALEHVGLTHAITWMVKELAAASTVEFSADVDDIDGLVAAETEISLYRIVQEVLNNVVKHAAATRARVTIRHAAAQITLQIEDDGCGFDMRRVRSDALHSFGLTGIAERVNLLQGRLVLKSAPGAGTRVIVTVPIAGTRA